MASPQYPKAGIYESGGDVAALSNPDSSHCYVVVARARGDWTSSLKFRGVDELRRNTWALDGHPDGSFFIQEGCHLEEWSTSKLSCTWTLRCAILDDIKPPSTKFPSVNFYKEDSPDTDTLIHDTCSGLELPKGPILRQIKLIQLYTGNQLYSQVNQALRDDDLDQMKYYGAFISELRDCFLTDHEYQIVKPFEGTVWRGITVDNADELIETVYTPGTDIVWSSFTSTSTDEASCFGGNILFEIRCNPPQGTYDDDDPEYAPACISEFSEYASENEVLVPPNVRFQVKYVTKTDSGGWKVVCDVNAFETAGKNVVSFGSRKVAPRSILNDSLDAMELAVNRMKGSEDVDTKKPKPEAGAERQEGSMNQTVSEKQALEMSSKVVFENKAERCCSTQGATGEGRSYCEKGGRQERDVQLEGLMKQSMVESRFWDLAFEKGGRSLHMDSVTKSGAGPTPPHTGNVFPRPMPLHSSAGSALCPTANALHGPSSQDFPAFAGHRPFSASSLSAPAHPLPCSHASSGGCTFSASTVSAPGVVRSLRQRVEETRLAEAEFAMQAAAWAQLQAQAQTEAWLAGQARAKFEAEARQAQLWHMAQAELHQASLQRAQAEAWQHWRTSQCWPSPAWARDRSVGSTHMFPGRW